MKKSPLLPIFLIVLVDVLGLTIIIPLLPIYAETFGASAFVVGLLISVYGLCQFIAGPLLGQISDRIGRKPLLLVSQVGTFIGLLILAYAHSLWPLFLSRIIDGLTAGNISVAQAYISDVTDPKNRAKSFGLIGIAFGLGFLVGPAVSGFLYRYGYRVPILTAAGLSFTSIVATAVLLPWRVPARVLATETPAGEKPRRKLPIHVFLESLTAPKLGVVLWQFFAFIFAFSLFISGFPLYAERRFVAGGRPFDVQHIGYVLALSGLIGVIIQGGLIGRLVHAFGERKLILFGFVSMTAAYAVMMPIHTVPSLLVVILLLSFGTSVVRPSMTSLVTQIVARHEQGMAIGLTQSLMAISQVIAPMVGGALINRGWLGAWAGLAALFCLGGLGLAANNPRG